MPVVAKGLRSGERCEDEIYKYKEKGKRDESTRRTVHRARRWDVYRNSNELIRVKM